MEEQQLPTRYGAARAPADARALHREARLLPRREIQRMRRVRARGDLAGLRGKLERRGGSHGISRTFRFGCRVSCDDQPSLPVWLALPYVGCERAALKAGSRSRYLPPTRPNGHERVGLLAILMASGISAILQR